MPKSLDRLQKIRWAPRLRPMLLQRLYESDARGFRDLELCESVCGRGLPIREMIAEAHSLLA